MTMDINVFMTKGPPNDPLSDPTELADSQHWYKPPHAQAPADSSLASSTTPTIQPDLIIVCGWAFAAPRHVVKYIAQYQLIYPQAQILFLQTNLGNLALTPDKMQMRMLKSTVGAMKEFLDTKPLKADRKAGTKELGRKEPIILVHAFSNGGSHSIVQLAQAYRESVQSTSASSTQPLLPCEVPVSALILDSSPGKSDFNAGVRAALSPFPQKATYTRLFATPLAYVIVAWVVIAHELGIEDIASKSWRWFNDTSGPFLVKARRGTGAVTAAASARDGTIKEVEIVPRTYIYSTRDDIVPWQNIHEHAGEARQAAARALENSNNVSVDVKDMIRLEGFAGSPHVNHVSVEPARY